MARRQLFLISFRTKFFQKKHFLLFILINMIDNISEQNINVENSCAP